MSIRLQRFAKGKSFWVLRRELASPGGPTGPQGAAPRQGNEGRFSRVGRSGAARAPLSLFNDPSAGSPTETLLRLLLPLNDRV